MKSQEQNEREIDEKSGTKLEIGIDVKWILKELEWERGIDERQEQNERGIWKCILPEF